MPELRFINCADCGRQRATKRRNTKYCSLCRLMRDLQFVQARLHKCWLCEVRFAPIGGRDNACPDCMYVPKSFGVEECAFCHQAKPRANPEIAVCHSCARDPKLRPKLINSLQRKIDEPHGEAVEV